VTGVYWPKPAEVEVGEGGIPCAVGSVAVEAVREEWLVEDRWWTPEPLRRRYFELALADGRCVVVYCEPAPEAPDSAAHPDPVHSPSPVHWFEQRA
jgi:hypothetical protein